MSIQTENETHQAELAVTVQKLSTDLHTVKGNLAANTAMTFETWDKLTQLSAAVEKLAVAQVEQQAGTVEVLDIVRNLKGGFKVAGWLGNGVKWMAGLALPLIGLWYALKGGGPHP